MKTKYVAHIREVSGLNHGRDSLFSDIPLQSLKGHSEIVPELKQVMTVSSKIPPDSPLAKSFDARYFHFISR
jgi:hypothetical protein